MRDQEAWNRLWEKCGGDVAGGNGSDGWYRLWKAAGRPCAIADFAASVLRWKADSSSPGILSRQVRVAFPGDPVPSNRRVGRVTVHLNKSGRLVGSDQEL